jgi:MFS family permease
MLTKSGLAVGGLFIVRWLAPVIVSPIAGVAADRYNRKTVLIITDIARAVVVLGFFFVRDAGDVWILYALSGVQLAISGFFFPARNAILPSIVKSNELGASNALSSATWSVMLALGTGLGGLVAGSMGVYAAFAIDAVTFLLSAGIIAMMDYTPRPREERINGGLREANQQYLDGFRYLKRNFDISMIALLKAIMSLVATGGMAVVQVALAKDVFVIGKEGGISMGLLFAAVGVGTGVGPIVARIFTGDRDRQLRIAIIYGFLTLSVGLVIMSIAESFWLVTFGTFLRGCGGGIVWVFTTQLLMMLLPDEIRGRIFAVELAMALLLSSVAVAVAGATIDIPAIGLSGTMQWMAGLTLIPMLLWAWYVTRRKESSAV